MSGMLRPRSVANPVILSHDFGGCEKQKIMVCQVWFQPSISSKLNTQSRGWQVISSHHSWFVGTVSARFSHQIWPDPIIHMRPAIRLPTKQRAGFTSLRRHFLKCIDCINLCCFLWAQFTTWHTTVAHFRRFQPPISSSGISQRTLRKSSIRSALMSTVTSTALPTLIASQEKIWTN